VQYIQPHREDQLPLPLHVQLAFNECWHCTLPCSEMNYLLLLLLLGPCTNSNSYSWLGTLS
jgi:hypothetical protein